MPLQACQLALGYAGEPLIKSVSFQIEPGEILAVVGHNGSGKSTLAKTLLGVIPPISGTLEWPQGRPRSIAYLGQRTEFDRRFPIRVRDLAAMGAWSRQGLFGWAKAQNQDLVEAALQRTNIAHIADQPLHVLSAGQLQRALFSRAIVQDSPLIVLDEPFTAIDQTTEADLLGLIDDWAAQGSAIILVLHDLSAVLKHCSKALLLGKNEALFGVPQEVLTPSNLVKYGYLSQSQAGWIETMYTNKEQANVTNMKGEGEAHV